MVKFNCYRLTVSIIITFVIYSAGIPAVSLADQSARQKEISLFWGNVMQGLNKIDIPELDVMLSQNNPDGRQPIKAWIALIFDNGKLRPVTDTDRNPASNHYITLLFEKNFVNRKWSIIALDNQNWNRKSFSYSDGVEIIYFYDKAFFHGFVAKSAEAFRNGARIAEANAIRRITTTMPYQLEVQETHYNNNNKEIYQGMLTIRLGEGGEITNESPISGQKISKIFNSWGQGRSSAR